MKKTGKAIRVEIPDELYVRFKECAEQDYLNVTTVARSLIVDYVRASEGRISYEKNCESGHKND
jgi:hypothetical protein